MRTITCYMHLIKIKWVFSSPPILLGFHITSQTQKMAFIRSE